MVQAFPRDGLRFSHVELAVAMRLRSKPKLYVVYLAKNQEMTQDAMLCGRERELITTRTSYLCRWCNRLLTEAWVNQQAVSAYQVVLPS
jgi:hypothetical protein